MAKFLYLFDQQTGEFMGTMQAQKRPNGQYITDVRGATAEPVPADIPEGMKARWTGTEWELVADHRQTRDKGGVIEEGSGTPYWLPGDTYESPARYMKELGDLPEGAILEKPSKPAEVLAQEAQQLAKAERAAIVAKNTVTVDGLVFNADEKSQNRLVRGIVASLALGLPADQTTEWTLADDSAAQVTVQQMAQALLLAGQAQTSVWRKPYEAQPASVQEE